MLNREVLAHTEGVQRLVRNAEIATGPKSRLVDSWRRSLANYGLDPSRTNEPRILTSHELREIRTPLERFLALVYRVRGEGSRSGAIDLVSPDGSLPHHSAESGCHGLVFRPDDLT